VKKRVNELDSKESGNESSSSSIKGDGHVCYVHFCSLCHSYHKRDENCYVQTIIPKNKQNYILVFIFYFGKNCYLGSIWFWMRTNLTS